MTAWVMNSARLDEGMPILSNKEWLSRLFDKLHLTPARAYALAFSVALLINAGLATVFDAWEPNANGPGLFAQPGVWAVSLLFQPAVVAYFVWVQKIGTRILKQLEEEGVFEAKGQLNTVLRKAQHWMRSPWLMRAGVVVGLLFTIPFVLAYSMPIQIIHAGENWVSAHPLIPMLQAPFLFAVNYSGALLVLDLIILIVTFNRIFDGQRMKVEPLHPDGAGGLGAIGSFSASLGYIIAVIGLTYVALFLQSPERVTGDVFAYAFIPFYLILAPVLFFLPLRSAHQAMLRYRNKVALEISSEFDRVFRKVREGRADSAEEIDLLLKRIRQLDETNKRIMKFPTWPFNVGSLGKYFSLVFTLLVPTAISMALDWLSGQI